MRLAREAGIPVRVFDSPPLEGNPVTAPTVSARWLPDGSGIACAVLAALDAMGADQ